MKPMTYLDKIRQLGFKTSLSRFHRKVMHKIRLSLHLPIRLKSIDRELLDKEILPWFANQEDVRKVLFVGCEYYTMHYPGIFPDSEFWTIEPDPAKSKFGSKNHIVGFLQDLESYANRESFDLIIFNGVYGWGLNNEADIEKSFIACHNCLRKDGILIFGWNNIKERTPVPLQNIEALKLFKPFIMPGFGSWRIETYSYNLHVFDLYRKM